MKSSRIEYFCNLCDSYKSGKCEILPDDEQERQVNKGFCSYSLIHGKFVEIQMGYVRINGRGFRKGSKDLEAEIEKLKAK